MNKKISIFLKIILVLFLVNFSSVFAATNTWNFSNPSNYTLSNSTSFNFNTSILRLNQNTLIHQGRINGTNYDGAYDVVVDGIYAYMTSYLGDRVTILNISNPASPTLVSQILNNNGTIRLDGAAGIVKDGNYLYVASQVSDALQIINVTNPASPTAAGQVLNTTTTRLDGARGIAKLGSYVYIASDVSDSLTIIDVSNPNSPVFQGTYRVANGNLNGARDVKVVGNYAYVANFDRDSLAVMDISTPTNPTFVTEVRDITLLDGAWRLAITPDGNYVYVSATLNNSVRIIDISNPISPVLVGGISGGSYSLGQPRNLIIDDNKLFITSYSNDAVNVADITDPINPVYITKILHNAAAQLLDGANGIFKVGNYLYVSSYLSDALEILRFDYDNTSPFVIPNTGFNYSGDIVSNISHDLGVNNEGNITYQISNDDGITWYYWDGSSWTSTALGVINSNDITTINTNIDSFNFLSGTSIFKFKAFLNSNGIQRVELDNFTLNTQIKPTPAGVSNNLALWYKTSSGLNSYTNNTNITSWQDYSYNGKTLTTGVTAPTLRNNINDNLNFYPLVNFNGSQSLENLANGGYSDTYFAVIVPNQTINGSLAGQVPFGFDCNSGVLSSGTCGLPFSGITLGAFTVAINDEVITHAIGSSVNWRSSQIGASSYSASRPMLLSINENSSSNGTNIYEKGLQINNFSVNTYQTLSTANVSLGRSLDGANPFPYNGKIAEIINFSDSLSDIDRQKIESYLAIKYGITLNNGNQNYLNSLGNVVWNNSTAGDYRNNIFGLSRDDASILSNVISRSSNHNGLLTIAAVGEGTNLSPSFVDMSDLEYQIFADNNLSNTWTQIGAPSGYDILSRKWKVTEIGDLGTLSITFDVNDSTFDIPTLNAGTNYYFIYDSNNNGLLSDEVPVSMINTSGSIWNISGINLSNNSIFTIATQSSANNIPTDINLSNSTILENVVSGSSVGILSSVDLDLGDSHIYTLVSGVGDTDNNFFNIVGNSLNIIDSPDYEIKNTYNIRLQTTDSNGGQYQKSFVINVINTGETINTIIDFENNEPSKYPVTSGNWFRGTSSSFEGTYSFESNNAGAVNSQSCFEINNTFYGLIGTIDFKYRVSSQAGADFLRFYIDNVEQQNWSGEVAWSTYNINNIPAGNHTYKWCYIKDGATNSGSDKAWIDYITFSYTTPDTNNPTINFTNFTNDVLLPGGNHNIVINYSDIGTGINPASANMEFYKWNGSSWGTNIYSSSLTPGVINTSQANYSTNNLSYGKYRYNFRIHDNYGNFVTREVVFYIDTPSFNISTANYISNVGPDYGTGEILVTINTIGAAYNLELLKNTNLVDNRGNIIINWNGSTGVGYDNEPYSGPKKDIVTNPVVATRTQLINTDGNLNTYIHRLKIKSLVGEEQAAGNYTMNISFRTIFNY